MSSPILPPWFTYSYSVLALLGMGVACSGWPVGWFSFFAPLLWLGLLLVGGMQWASVVWLWKQQGLRSLLPAMACTASFVGAPGFGECAFLARFSIQRSHYDEVAEQIRSGSYSADVCEDARSVVDLKPADTALGYNAHVRCEKNAVVEIFFLAVSHGFAGHGGYTRTFESRASATSARFPIPFLDRRFGGGWYAVGG